MLSYRTDTVIIAPAGELACFDAAMVHATGINIGELGFAHVLPPAPGYGLTFTKLVDRFATSAGLGNLFTLRKTKKHATVADIFKATTGIFMIHCMHFHKEDMGEYGAESIAHYVVYNADTRVLFLYPEVRRVPCPIAPHASSLVPLSQCQWAARSVVQLTMHHAYTGDGALRQRCGRRVDSLREAPAAAVPDRLPRKTRHQRRQCGLIQVGAPAVLLPRIARCARTRIQHAHALACLEHLLPPTHLPA
jgi:hypothetical protein